MVFKKYLICMFMIYSIWLLFHIFCILNCRFFFKKHCEEFGVIQEEMIGEDDILPMYEGKIFAQIRKSDWPMLNISQQILKFGPATRFLLRRNAVKLLKNLRSIIGSSANLKCNKKLTKLVKKLSQFVNRKRNAVKQKIQLLKLIVQCLKICTNNSDQNFNNSKSLDKF